jgi:hypothetical protein
MALSILKNARSYGLANHDPANHDHVFGREACCIGRTWKIDSPDAVAKIVQVVDF